MNEPFFVPVRSHTQRLYSGDGAGLWLVVIDTLLQPRPHFDFDSAGRSLDTMPACRCVVDDFGNLVPVRGWL